MQTNNWEFHKPLEIFDCELCSKKTVLSPWCTNCAQREGVKLGEGARGLGLFATKELPLGFTLTYGGKLLQKREYYDRYRGKFAPFIIQGANGIYDAAVSRSWGSMINSAAAPERANTQFEDTERNGPMVVTTKNIKSGEELLSFYLFDHTNVQYQTDNLLSFQTNAEKNPTQPTFSWRQNSPIQEHSCRHPQYRKSESDMCKNCQNPHWKKKCIYRYTTMPSNH